MLRIETAAKTSTCITTSIRRAPFVRGENLRFFETSAKIYTLLEKNFINSKASLAINFMYLSSDARRGQIRVPVRLAVTTWARFMGVCKHVIIKIPAIYRTFAAYVS